MKRFAVLAFFALALFVPVRFAYAVPVLVDFDAIDATGGAVSGALVDTYFAGFGITVGNFSDASMRATVQRASAGVVDGVSAPYIVPDSPFNVFYLTGPLGTGSYSLSFAAPVSSVSFIRSAIIPVPAFADIRPEWSVIARDAGNNILASGGESFFSSSSIIAAQSFTFTGQISSLDFAYDVHGVSDPFVIDNLQFEPASEPATLVLLTLGLAGLGFSRRTRA